MGICGSRDRNEVIIPKKNFMKDEMSELFDLSLKKLNNNLIKFQI